MGPRRLHKVHLVFLFGLVGVKLGKKGVGSKGKAKVQEGGVRRKAFQKKVKASSLQRRDKGSNALQNQKEGPAAKEHAKKGLKVSQKALHAGKLSCFSGKARQVAS